MASDYNIVPINYGSLPTTYKARFPVFLRPSSYPSFVVYYDDADPEVWGENCTAGTCSYGLKYTKPAADFPDLTSESCVLMELNGDGLKDVLCGETNYSGEAWINTGGGFEKNTMLWPPTSISFQGLRAVSIVDLNGDGLDV